MKTILTALLAIVATMTTKALDIKSAIAEYYRRCPQEKIFIHTDKDQYMAGDTVWFRAHLVDAMTMTERSESKFVYVELYDSNMSLQDRRMVKADSCGVFANALRLSPQMATGSYILMAYTTWMQNFPNSRFFYKRLTVAEKDARSIAPAVADEVTYVGGNTLPDAGVTTDIKLSQRSEHLMVEYKPEGGMKGEDLSLAIFGSGNLVVVDSIGDKPVTFRQQDLSCGVVNIAVVKRMSGEVVAERLAFIKGAGLPEVSVSLGGEQSVRTLGISVKNIVGAPLTGDFSISVTDADVVECDTTQQDIAAYLLSGSELEPLHSVEEWKNGSVAAAVKQDIIMSRQTDMRFRLDDMLKGNLPRLTHDIQRDQRISGTVQGTLSKKLKAPRITLFNPAGGVMDTYELPYNSHFNLTDMDFADGVTFIVEATRHTGSNSLVRLKLDEQAYPAPYAIKPKTNTPLLLTDDFLKYERMHAAINGINEINYLEEIEVRGHKTSKDEGMRGLSIRPNYDRDTDGPVMYNDMRTWLLAMGLPRRTNMIIYIDEIRSDYESLLRLDPRNVKSIHNFASYTDLVGDFSAPTKSYLNTPVGGFFVAVETTNYKPTLKDNPLAIQVVSPLGYMPPVSTAAFGTPREEGAPDVRTTLYWSPYVKLSDNGEARVMFYPTDTSRRYRVTIQGVTITGQIISKEIEL